MKAVMAKRKRMLYGDALGLTDNSYYYYNGAFLPGLKKLVKKVGSFTRPITTSIAQTFLPASLVNAAAKLDPTRKGGAEGAAATQAIAKMIEQNTVNPQNAPVKTDAEIKRDALMATLTDPKVLGIAGAGVIALILLSKKR